MAIFVASCSYAAPNELILMRHLHKANGDNPPLSNCGIAQAQAIKQLLDDTVVSTIWYTQYRRTEQTAKTVVENAKQAMQYDASLPVQSLITQLQASTGIQLVVGHSNTIPALLHALSGVTVTLGEHDYGTLYHLRWRKGQWQLQQLHITQPPQCTVPSTASQ